MPDFGPDTQRQIDDILHDANIEIYNRVQHIDEALQGQFVDEFEQEFADPSSYGRLNRENLLRLRMQMLAEADAAMEELWSPESPPIRRAMERIAELLGNLEDEEGNPRYEISPEYVSRVLRRAHQTASGRQATPEGMSETRGERRWKEERSATGVATQLRRLVNKPKRKPGETKKAYEARIAKGTQVLYSPQGGVIRSRIHKGMLTQPQVGEEEANIYLIRQRIIELEKDIKARYGKDPKLARGTQEYEELKQLRREFDKRSRVWVRQVLNLSGVKQLAYSEAVKQLQYAQMNMVKGFGFYLARWTLSPLHPRTDVCDVCAREEWLDPQERVTIIQQAIREENKSQGVDTNSSGFEEWLSNEWPEVIRSVGDWRGVVALPPNTLFSQAGGLLIPKLLDMSEGEVAALIDSYPRVRGLSPDRRKKLGGYYPPHPLCKCKLIPVELDILLYEEE